MKTYIYSLWAILCLISVNVISLYFTLPSEGDFVVPEALWEANTPIRQLVANASFLGAHPQCARPKSDPDDIVLFVYPKILAYGVRRFRLYSLHPRFTVRTGPPRMGAIYEITADKVKSLPENVVLAFRVVESDKYYQNMWLTDIKNLEIIDKQYCRVCLDPETDDCSDTHNWPVFDVEGTPVAALALWEANTHIRSYLAFVIENKRDSIQCYMNKSTSSLKERMLGLAFSLSELQLSGSSDFMPETLLYETAIPGKSRLFDVSQAGRVILELSRYLTDAELNEDVVLIDSMLRTLYFSSLYQKRELLKLKVTEAFFSRNVRNVVQELEEINGSLGNHLERDEEPSLKIGIDTQLVEGIITDIIDEDILLIMDAGKSKEEKETIREARHSKNRVSQSYSNLTNPTTVGSLRGLLRTIVSDLNKNPLYSLSENNALSGDDITMAANAIREGEEMDKNIERKVNRLSAALAVTRYVESLDGELAKGYWGDLLQLLDIENLANAQVPFVGALETKRDHIILGKVRNLPAEIHWGEKGSLHETFLMFRPPIESADRVNHSPEVFIITKGDLLKNWERVSLRPSPTFGLSHRVGSVEKDKGSNFYLSSSDWRELRDYCGKMMDANVRDELNIHVDAYLSLRANFMETFRNEPDEKERFLQKLNSHEGSDNIIGDAFSRSLLNKWLAHHYEGEDNPMGGTLDTIKGHLKDVYPAASVFENKSDLLDRSAGDASNKGEFYGVSSLLDAVGIKTDGDMFDDYIQASIMDNEIEKELSELSITHLQKTFMFPTPETASDDLDITQIIQKNIEPKMSKEDRTLDNLWKISTIIVCVLTLMFACLWTMQKMNYDILSIPPPHLQPSSGTSTKKDLLKKHMERVERGTDENQASIQGRHSREGLLRLRRSQDSLGLSRSFARKEKDFLEERNISYEESKSLAAGNKLRKGDNIAERSQEKSEESEMGETGKKKYIAASPTIKKYGSLISDRDKALLQTDESLIKSKNLLALTTSKKFKEDIRLYDVEDEMDEKTNTGLKTVYDQLPTDILHQFFQRNRKMTSVSDIENQRANRKGKPQEAAANYEEEEGANGSDRVIVSESDEDQEEECKIHRPGKMMYERTVDFSERSLKNSPAFYQASDRQKQLLRRKKAYSEDEAIEKGRLSHGFYATSPQELPQTRTLYSTDDLPLKWL